MFIVWKVWMDIQYEKIYCLSWRKLHKENIFCSLETLYAFLSWEYYTLANATNVSHYRGHFCSDLSYIVSKVDFHECKRVLKSIHFPGKHFKVWCQITQKYLKIWYLDWWDVRDEDRSLHTLIFMSGYSLYVLQSPPTPTPDNQTDSSRAETWANLSTLSSVTWMLFSVRCSMERSSLDKHSASIDQWSGDKVTLIIIIKLTKSNLLI